MHTYILREEREEQKEGEGGRKEVQLSASAPEQLNREAVAARQPLSLAQNVVQPLWKSSF